MGDGLFYAVCAAMISRLSMHDTLVLTGSRDAEGRLVYADGRLCAVLVKLSADHGDLEGCWHLEVGFGPCEARCAVFPDLDAARAWIDARLASLVA